jgi:1-deoxy-D-xylulose-5-phosphate reductoisomerase
VVHSMVEFTDGCSMAQLSLPDMRLPIGYALAHPERIGTPYGRIDWTELSRLDFAAPDRRTFRCLDLAYRAGRAGGSLPAFLSAANEVAVESFLAGALRWPDIAAVIEASLDEHIEFTESLTSEHIIDADRQGRDAARRVLGSTNVATRATS